MAGGRVVLCRLRPRVVAVLFAWGVICTVAAGSARAAETIEAIRVGVAGVYRVDRWCPVELRIAGIEAEGEYRVAIDAVDQAGRRIRYTAKHRLLAREPNRIAQLVRLGRSADSLAVGLFDEAGRLVAERRFDRADLATPLDDVESLVVVIGRLSGLDGVEALQSDKTRRVHYRQIAGLSQLPTVDKLSPVDRALALDCVTTVVWMAGQSVNAADNVVAGRPSLLDDWVRAGGRLIVSLGTHATEALRGSALEARLDLTAAGERAELRQAAALEAFLGVDSTAPASRANAGREERPFRLEVARIAPDEGVVAAAASQTDAGLRLVVRVPHGFGEVVVVAFDLSDPALVAWPGHTRLLARILALGEAETPSSAIDLAGKQAWDAKAYSSISEQLADALDQFPGASPERFWYLAAAAVVYILVIGPVDLYLVRRRPEWTWATFLATVCVAAAGAYGIVHFTKSDEALVNHLGFADVDLTGENAGDSNAAQTARIRGNSWMSIYQPTSGVVDVAVDAPLPWESSSQTQVANADGEQRRARLALWSPSLGGSNGSRFLARRGADNMPMAVYSAGNGGIGELSQPAWSSELFAGRWTADVSPRPVATLSADAFGRVVGTVRNPLDVPLEQTVLFYGAYSLAIGKLAPGQTANVDSRGDWRSAEAYLTRQRLTQDRETAEKYNPTSVDLARIGEIVGLYRAAGGEAYTGLDNRGVEAVDMSNQLRLGRAILMGRTSAGPRVTLSPTTPIRPAVRPHRETTWWRFLIRPAAELPNGK